MARKSKATTSFGTGFMVGMLTGVFGYLAFGTHKGDDFRENLRDKFEEAREILYEEGIIDDPEMPFPEVVAVLRAQAESLIEASKGKKSTTTKKQKKFTGT